MHRVNVCLVVPIFNEALVIEVFFNRLRSVFSKDVIENHGIDSVSLVLVDDGSSDDSIAKILLHCPKELRCRVIRLSRNFGHQSAVSAGLIHSSGDIICVADADLQDPPETILEMVKVWREGFDVVYGIRQNRKEGPLARFFYWSFYRMYKFLADVDVPVDSGDFALLDRSVVNALNNLPEKIRFPRGLRSWVGFKQKGVPYNRPARAAGETKYNLIKLYRLATNGIASMSIRPLQVTQVFAFIYFVSAVSVAMLIMMGKMENIVDSDLIFVTVLLSFALLFGSIHVIGAYLGRAYLEIKARPNHIIAEDFDVQDFRSPAAKPRKESCVA